jgi:hypothetical protein
MTRPPPLTLVSIASLARLAKASRHDVLKAVTAGELTAIARVDYGRGSMPLFEAEAAIALAAKIHPPKSAGMVDVTTT